MRHLLFWWALFYGATAAASLTPTTGVNAARLQGRLISTASPSAGNALSWNALSSEWEPSSAGSGSVSSVGLSLPAIFSVTDSPVTSTGTLAATLTNQSTNFVWAGPSSGSAVPPSFRALVPGDIPSLDTSKISSGQGTISTSTPGVAVVNGANATLGPNTTINVQTASGSQPGLLAAADFTTFNSKVPAARAVNTTSPLTGGGDLSADRTLAIPAATNSVGGYLTSADWTAFNAKFNLPALTSGSVLFSNGTTIAQDNAALNWNDSTKVLGVVGTVNTTLSLTDSAGSAGVFSATSHTTVDGSNTTIGINGAATGIVDVGATNDKTIGGMNFVVTRGDGNDQGTLDSLNGINVLMFGNSDTAGITNKAYGVSSFYFSQKGTVTDLYDFYSERVPAGSGVVTNHYGVYVKNDNDTPVKNWLSGVTRIGGSSATPTTDAALDLAATDKALVLNRLDSTAEGALTATNGMTIYNTTSDKFRCYQGGAWTDCIGTGGGGSPAGSDGQIQFNSSGSFGADSKLFWDNSTKTLKGGTKFIVGNPPFSNPTTVQMWASAGANNFILAADSGSSGDGGVAIGNADGAGFLNGFRADYGDQADLFIQHFGHVVHLGTAGLAWPNADGTNGQFLKTDGGGNLSFASPPAPGTHGHWIKYTKTFSDFSDPSTSKTINLATMNAGYDLLYYAYNLTQTFTGGTVSAVDLLITAGSTGGLTSFDVFTALTQGPPSHSNAFEPFGNPNNFASLTLTTTGDNIDQLTQGSVDVYLFMQDLNNDN